MPQGSVMVDKLSHSVVFVLGIVLGFGLSLIAKLLLVPSCVDSDGQSKTEQRIAITPTPTPIPTPRPTPKPLPMPFAGKAIVYKGTGDHNYVTRKLFDTCSDLGAHRIKEGEKPDLVFEGKGDYVCVVRRDGYVIDRVSQDDLFGEASEVRGLFGPEYYYREQGISAEEFWKYRDINIRRIVERWNQ